MRSYLSVIACIIILTVLPGCWNERELNTIALVQAIGLDRTQNGQISLSLQLLKPSEIKSSTSENGGGSNGVWVVTSQGETVFDALRNATEQTDRRSYFTHNRVIVISEDIARDGIADILDLLNRDHELRPREYVFITKRKAVDILKSEQEQEKIPGMAIANLAKLTQAASKIPMIDLLALDKNLASKTNDSILPGIDFSQENEGSSTKKLVNLSGTAVFKKDKLIGWFDTTETRGTLWIQNKVKSGIIVVTAPGDETKKVSIEVIKSSSNLVPEKLDGQLMITINVQVQGNLAEQMSDVDLAKPDSFNELEERMAAVIENEINSALVKAQKWNVDIFKFGEEFHRRFPEEWPELENNWGEEFPKIKVNVAVDAKLRRTGLITKPVQLKEDEGADGK